MSCLAVIGVPRTAYTLEETVVQARLRGLDVVLVDTPRTLERVPATLPASRVAVAELTLDLVEQALRPVVPVHVLAVSELYLVLAARVRAALDLSGVPVDVEELVRDKAATRARLRERELSSAGFAVARLTDLERVTSDFALPVVIKPPDLTGSIGVRAIRTRPEVAEYFQLFADAEIEKARDRKFLVEEFIGGQEFSVEGLCVDGRFHLIAVTRKENTGYPLYHETGHLLPAEEAEPADRFNDFLSAVTTALAIPTAPIHAEVKVDGDTIELIEIHTRFGGDLIPLLIERAFDVKPFGLFYDALLHGQAPPPLKARRVAGIQFVPAGQEIRLAPACPGGTVTAELVTEPGQDPESLDNFRILHRRGGHVVFTAPDYAAAARYRTTIPYWSTVP